MPSSDPTAKKRGRARLRLSKGDKVLAEVSLGSKKVIVGSGQHAKIRLKKKGLPEEILILDGTQSPVVLESKLPPDKVFLNGWAVSRGFFKPGDRVEFLGLTLEMLAPKQARPAVSPAEAPSTDDTGTAPEIAAQMASARGRAGAVPKKKTRSSPIAADSTAPEAAAARFPPPVEPVHPAVADTTHAEVSMGRSVAGVHPVLDGTAPEAPAAPPLDPVPQGGPAPAGTPVPFAQNTDARIQAAEAEIAAMQATQPPPQQPLQGSPDPPGPVPMDVSELLSQASVAEPNPFPAVDDAMLDSIPPRTDLVGDDATSSKVALDLTGPAQELFPSEGSVPAAPAMPPAPSAPTRQPDSIDIIDVQQVAGQPAPEARRPATTNVQGDPLAAALSDALSDGLNPFEPQAPEDPTAREQMLRAAEQVRGRTQSKPDPEPPPGPAPFQPVPAGKDDITGPENLDDRPTEQDRPQIVAGVAGVEWDLAEGSDVSLQPGQVPQAETTNITRAPFQLDQPPAAPVRPPQQREARREPAPELVQRGRKKKPSRRDRKAVDYPDFPRRRPLRGFLIGMFVVGGLAGAAYGVYSLMQNPEFLQQTPLAKKVETPDNDTPGTKVAKNTTRNATKNRTNATTRKNDTPAVGANTAINDGGSVPDFDDGGDTDVRDIFSDVDTSFTTSKVDTSDLDAGGGANLRAARSINATELNSIYLDGERPRVRKYYPELWDPATNYGGTQGELDAGAMQINTNRVEAKIIGQYPAIKQCLLRSGGFKGSRARVVVNFTINTNGRVSEVSIPSSDVQGAKFRTCVKKTIQRMKFPRPKESSVVVIYPFVFTRN